MAFIVWNPYGFALTLQEMAEFMGDFIDNPFDATFGSWYDLRTREADATSLATSAGYGTPDGIQAATHAFTSATLAYELGNLHARILGDGRELIWRGNNPKDNFRDLWNNEVGRRISDYAKEHNLPEAAINDLIADALKNGELITDYNTDPRVPANFSGDLRDFDTSKVGWQGPSPNWNGAGGGNGGVPPGGYPPPPAPPGGGTPGGGTPGAPNGGPGGFDPNGPFYDPPLSPLVFDLDGDGLEIIPLSESSAHFDLNENGFAEHTAWIGSDDGFLARDINSNGIIDDLSELFGGAEIDGFTRLSELDSNNDKVIDALDAAFGELKLWRDLDSDGVTDQGELTSLSSESITRIDLAADYINEWNGENWLSHKSSYVKDGATKEIYDIWFENDQVNTIYRSAEGQVPPLNVRFLPNLAGYGTMPDLSQVLTVNPELREDFEEFVVASIDMSPTELRSNIEVLLHRWAGVSNVSAGSRGSYVDAKHLAFLEALHGQGFVSPQGTPNPYIQAGLALEEYYSHILDSMIGKILIQLPASNFWLRDGASATSSPTFDVLENLYYDVTIDKVLGDFSQVIAKVAAKLDDNFGGDGAGVVKGLELLSLLDLFSQDIDAGEQSYSDYVYGNLEQNGLSAFWLRIQDAAANLPVQVGSDANESISLTKNNSAQVLAGAAGNDTLRGGNGSDVYIYGEGDGNDQILEGFAISQADKLFLGPGLLAEDISIERSTSDLDDVTLRFTGVEGSIFLDEQFANPLYGYGIEEIIFGDGTVWTKADLLEEYLESSGTTGNDTIIGTNDVNDTLDCGPGNDILKGLSGSDTYVYEQGDGDDQIVESYPGTSDTDRLELGTGLLAQSLIIQRSTADSDDVTLRFNGIEGSILLDEQFYGYSSGYGIEEIEFADSTVWTKADLRAAYLNSISTAGNDTIIGFNGLAETLTGSKGGDVLKGLSGSDTYVYNEGDGNDQIFEDNWSGDTDRVILGPGLLAGSTIVERSTTDADDLTIRFAGKAGSIFIDEGLSNPAFGYGIEEIEFADSTVWDKADLRAAYLSAAQTSGNDTVVGFEGVNDTLDGGAGNDILKGLGGGDTYIYDLGDGDDQIVEGYASNDTDRLVLGTGLLVEDVIVERSTSDADDVTIRFDGIAGSIFLDEIFYSASSGYGVEEIEFADSTVWTKSDLWAAYLGASATSGNDTILGVAKSNDTLDGGAGNDVLEGLTGSDTYIYELGDGDDQIIEGAGSSDTDRLELGSGLLVADLILERSTSDADDATIQFDGVTGSIFIDELFANPSSGYGLEEIEFADSTVWTKADLRAAYLSTAQTSGDDTVLGFNGIADVINGGTGNDVLKGGTGNDTYIYELGDGDDEIVESFSIGEIDRVELGAGLLVADIIVERSASDAADAIIRFDGVAGSILLQQTFASWPDEHGVDEIEFADSTVWDKEDLRSAYLASAQTSDDDTVLGFGRRDDTLQGGTGNDILKGFDGSDTYIYNLGDGADQILESYATGETDRLDLGTGLLVQDIIVQRSTTDADDVTISFDGVTGSIFLDEVFHGSTYGYGIEEIEFADSTVWDKADLRAAYLTAAQTSGNDTVLGFDDTADTLDGGAGNDILKGLGGNDTYVYELGDGNDQIFEAYGNGETDRLVLGAGLLVSDIIVERSTSDADDVTLRFDGVAGSIFLDETLSSSSYGYGIEEIEFADSTVWDRSDLLAALSNNRPSAVDDTAQATEETPATMTAASLLANDTDADEDELEIVSVGNATHGTVSLNQDGNPVFTPEADFTGQASFDYTVADPYGGTDVGTVTVTVSNTNDAPVAVNDTANATEDTAATILASSLKSNDGDADNDTLLITAVGNAVNGTAVLNQDGNIVFTPTANFSGQASFDYTVSDGKGGTDTGTVTVTIANVNDAPIAVDDSASATEDTAATILASALRSNDTDADNDTLQITAVSNATHGSVALNQDGNVVFTPAANYSGAASFEYTVSDGNGGTDTATVSVTVASANDAPVADDDSVDVARNSQATINAFALLGNDEDADNDTLGITGVGSATNGSVALNQNGDVEFTPTTNFTGQASFQYTVSDGNGGSDTATVTVNVLTGNDAPSANNDAANATEDTAATILASSLLSNDSDPNSDDLDIVSVGNATHGTVALNGSGNVVFTPEADYAGQATFDYTVSDGNGGADTATVTVTIANVNDAPVAASDTASATEDTPATILASALFANETDIENDDLEITSVGAAVNGSVSLNQDGDVVFTPSANFSGEASFEYTVSDGNGGSDTATVSVTVSNVNDAPVATNDTAQATEDQAVTILGATLRGNDSDADGDALQITSVGNATHGSASLTQEGNVVFTPDANYAGNATFDYTVSDGNGGSDTATVTVAVANTNDAPVATADTASTAEDTPVTILSATLKGNVRTSMAIHCRSFRCAMLRTAPSHSTRTAMSCSRPRQTMRELRALTTSCPTAMAARRQAPSRLR